MLFSLNKLLNPSLFKGYLSAKNKAIKLNAFDSKDLIKAAEIIKNGGIIAFPFNGVFGLFGDINNKKVIEKINLAKGRPQDKKLVIVVLPEMIHEFLDLTKIPYSHDQIKKLWEELHALGILAPPHHKVPKHVTELGSDINLIAIWTEYEPMRKLINEFQKIGGKALFGTSANKTGSPTYTHKDRVWADFIYDVDAIIEANFDYLPAHRQKSATIINLTNKTPILIREGNVQSEEINEVFKKMGLNELSIPENYKKV